jgi:hypothetical protein
MSEHKISSFDWALWFQWLMATSIGWVLGRFLLPNLAFVVIGIALGILQWLILQQRFQNAWWWIVATALGWTLGSVITIVALPAGMDFTAGVILGTTTGAAQWLILRREVHWSGWWIMVNVIAWTTGLAFLPGIFLTGVMAGLITATALVLLLRYPKSIEESQNL